MEGDVPGDKFVAEGGEGQNDGEGVAVVKVRGLAAKGEARGGEDQRWVKDGLGGELDEGVSGLVAVRGGGGKDGCCNGEVSTGRPVGESGVVEVGAVFLRVVETAVKVEVALGKLTSDGGACGGPTVVSSGSDVIAVAMSPAEAVRALDDGKVAEQVAGRSGVKNVVGDKEVVVDVEKAAVDVGVGVVKVVDGG